MRLKCGGFILALCVNHTIAMVLDFSFASAVAEFDHGAEIPSVRPIWQRHLLNARDLPHAYMHHEYENILEPAKLSSHLTIWFSAASFWAIRDLRFSLPPLSTPPSLHHLRTSSNLHLALLHNRYLSKP
ncbi:UNVERIFIED_CONTAM: Methanol O-anthraniloyltransferase [Sesamum radiatum]|uniref:Methanol O-anthraniloyltransferase n=1 Tax=Sesamum radiatum TaxID=300843 RepID=A0AAW2USL0_SESRA